jgi:hypothetical protein
MTGPGRKNDPVWCEFEELRPRELIVADHDRCNACNAPDELIKVVGKGVVVIDDQDFHEATTASIVAEVGRSVGGDNQSGGARGSPPQLRRGGRDIKKKIAQLPLMERTGWCWSRSTKTIFTSTTPSARNTDASQLFLIAQPPLLG